jgi:hypothetical protein
LRLKSAQQEAREQGPLSRQTLLCDNPSLAIGPLSTVKRMFGIASGRHGAGPPHLFFINQTIN